MGACRGEACLAPAEGRYIYWVVETPQGFSALSRWFSPLSPHGAVETAPQNMKALRAG